MVRSDKIHQVAVALNARIDVPGVPEWAEQFALDRLAASLDRFIPDSYLDVMLAVSDGISRDEATGWANGFVYHLRTRLPGVLSGLGVVDAALNTLRDALVDLMTEGASA